LVDEFDEADVVLDVVFETADKQVLSLGVDGRVNEFRLNYRVSLRAYDLKQQDWLPAEEFTQRRDFSYDDTQIFAKEAEEVLLQKNMRTDMVQQIIRRLGNARPQ
jgi:LPS-assembly lipoprotein